MKSHVKKRETSSLGLQKKSKAKPTLAIVGGVFTGTVNGLFGGGGGMIAVPLLNKVLKEETKVSHATAILVILPITIASAIMYIVNGYFEALPSLSTMIGVIIGGVVGAVALKKLPANAVALVFALMMIGAGLKLIIH